MSKTAKILSFSLPPKLLREIERGAQREARTKSEFVREAIRRYLATQKEETLMKLRELEQVGERIATKKGWQTEEQVEKEVAKIIAEGRYGQKS